MTSPLIKVKFSDFTILTESNIRRWILSNLVNVSQRYFDAMAYPLILAITISMFMVFEYLTGRPWDRGLHKAEPTTIIFPALACVVTPAFVGGRKKLKPYKGE